MDFIKLLFYSILFVGIIISIYYEQSLTAALLSCLLVILLSTPSYQSKNSQHIIIDNTKICDLCRQPKKL